MNFQVELRQKLDEVFEVDINSIHKKLVKEFGDSIYLVGGAVRDKIIGEIEGRQVDSKDMDYIVTGVPMDDLKQRLMKTITGSKINEVGQKFGIIKVQIGNDELEFAIPRKDVDRKTVMPDHTISIEKDLERRDLTFNAVAERLSDGKRVFPSGEDPIADIKNKTIKCVGNPEDRFEEDPLRILRTLQFAARFGYNIHPDTLRAIRIKADLLLDQRRVDKSQFKAEFMKAWTKGKKDTKYFFDLLEKTNVGTILYGSDFKPIPIKMTHSVKNPYLVQSIGMFLNGGNYKNTVVSNEDQKNIELAQMFKTIIEDGFDVYKHTDFLKNKVESFYDVTEAFKKIDSRLYNAFLSVTNKPIVPFIGNEWKKWMLPLNANEIIDIAGEVGITLTGKAIRDVQYALINAYNLNKIPTSSSLQKSKTLSVEFLKSELLHDRKLTDSVNVSIIQERIKNILES
jgi:hypothetical protein